MDLRVCIARLFREQPDRRVYVVFVTGGHRSQPDLVWWCSDDGAILAVPGGPDPAAAPRRRPRPVTAHTKTGPVWAAAGAATGVAAV